MPAGPRAALNRDEIAATQRSSPGCLSAANGSAAVARGGRGESSASPCSMGSEVIRLPPTVFEALVEMWTSVLIAEYAALSEDVEKRAA